MYMCTYVNMYIYTRAQTCTVTDRGRWRQTERGRRDIDRERLRRLRGKRLGSRVREERGE